MRPAPITWQTARCEATAAGWLFVMPVVQSANRLWRKGRRGMYKTDQASDDVTNARTVFGTFRQMRGEVAVWILWVRKARAGDVDNRVKATLDTLKGVAFGDDARVGRVTVERVDDPTRAAGLYVWVEPFRPTRLEDLAA
jgi:Holliday junction resolvase RusA-like endonuclease